MDKKVVCADKNFVVDLSDKGISENILPLLVPFDGREVLLVVISGSGEKSVNQKEFILVQDNSDAWYVIPSDRHGDWMSFLGSDEIEQGSIPSYADRVGGHPCKVTFQNYRIKHVCCACCC